MPDSNFISELHKSFIAAQEMFFVATAPLSPDGHVNVSPKGLAGTFAVIDEHTVAYLDSYGSGIETIAHLRENGRVCVMFCSFGEKPQTLRLWGQGEPIEPDHANFTSLRAHFPELPGTRAIIRLNVSRVATSCGFGIPRYTFEGHRTELPDYAEEWGEEKVRSFTQRLNEESIDGLPGTKYWMKQPE
ncbi:MAG: pyridoxamine 5'-phosphate oxidase family protein [Planctomycetes bacterium]|nr:pyridoxamine 5'-phosphate oxidase family protein [Planctomycetota bacterium]MCP4838518.1 pyridoxamine 5'-phosphate oxidase family protein [Planctomycetota bacterium]